MSRAEVERFVKNSATERLSARNLKETILAIAAARSEIRHRIASITSSSRERVRFFREKLPGIFSHIFRITAR